MPEAVIVSTARTPIGRAYRGAFNDTEGQTLAGHVVENPSTRPSDTRLRVIEKLC